mmetsp:Transcript_100325/g.283019  ORF Transcript_100325/g.283019 Transcript_100325/m.283019 type:complete len:335 (+) Transcript_100325:34-1038(+)
MMFKASILATIATAVLAANAHDRSYYEEKFFDFLQKFEVKLENGEEFLKRLQIFADNVDIIEKHNADPTQTFKMGFNKFTHMTFEEFKDTVRIGGARIPNLRKNPDGPMHEAPADRSTLGSEVDWVAKGAVTDVKDQGNCGSCWSFSTTGSLEGAYYLKTGSLTAFSEQEMVSCDNVDAGCNGGWMDDAFEFVKKNGGLPTEEDYPYTSGTTGKSGTCETGHTNVAAVAPKSYTDVRSNVDALMSAVAQQPVSIAIQANQLAFQFYDSGVLTGNCGQRLDHGVLAVGYGTENGVDYWKVKNSWGDSWGEDGYIKIERSDADLCGVLDAASYPNL